MAEIIGGPLVGRLSIPQVIDMVEAELQEKTAISSVREQVVEPDKGYDGMTKVTIAGLPYSKVSNDSGGETLTLG